MGRLIRVHFMLKEKMPENVDEIWPEVKAYYESAYSLRFNRMPSNDEVRELYLKMKKLGQEERDYFRTRQHEAEQFERYVTIKKGITP